MALRPNRMVGGGCNSKGINTYPVANGYASAIGWGDPVKLSAGYVQLATHGEPVLGVAMGVNTVENDQPVARKDFVAATSLSSKPYDSFGGLTVPTIKVLDDPQATFTITADATVTAGHVGLNFRLASIGTVVAHSGESDCKLDVSTATTSGGDATSADAQTMVRLIRVVETPGNELGDATPVVEVKFIYHEDKVTNVL